MIVTFNLRWVVEMVLRKLGVLHMFTSIHDRFEVHQAMGKPALMSQLMTTFGVTGDCTILVDDDINNLTGCQCRLVSRATRHARIQHVHPMLGVLLSALRFHEESRDRRVTRSEGLTSHRLFSGRCTLSASKA